MGGGGTPSQTTNVTKTEMPAWVDAAGQANYNKAVELDAAPLQQYAGPRVAPVSATTTQANNLFKNNVGRGDDKIAQAGGIFSDLADPTKVAAGAQGLLNPYLGQVETNALRAMDESRVKSLQGNADKAVAAKAFGGSRGAIVDAITNSETAKASGDLSANIRSAGYDKSMANYLGSQGAAAEGLMGVGGAQGKGLLEDFATLSQIGGQEQTQNQAQINADMAKFAEGRDKELNDLNLRLSALGMSPYSTSSTTNQTSTQGSQGTDWAMTGLGLLSLFAGLSEDTEKEDVKKLGKVGDTPLNMYAYRYKGDPKSYPKVVGVMASEVEKFMPEAVHEVGGKRVIDYGMLAEAL